MDVHNDHLIAASSHVEGLYCILLACCDIKDIVEGDDCSHTTDEESTCRHKASGPIFTVFFWPRGANVLYEYQYQYFFMRKDIIGEDRTTNATLMFNRCSQESAGPVEDAEFQRCGTFLAYLKPRTPRLKNGAIEFLDVAHVVLSAVWVPK